MTAQSRVIGGRPTLHTLAVPAGQTRSASKRFVARPVGALLALAAVQHVSPSPLRAETLVAVVEDVRGAPAGAEFMDYLAPGKVIRLGPADAIVLSYVRSCVRETIAAGTVTVGTQISTVDGGTVERAKVACDGGRLHLTPEQANTAGGTVLREARQPGAPQLMLHGASPVPCWDWPPRR